jgi:type II secretory pathway pseudopilin PulG
MMVVAILGLTLSMGIPRIGAAIKREGMGKVVRELVEACQSARRAAIMKSQPIDLVIRPTDRTFSVPGEFDACQIPDTVLIEILGVNFVPLQNADEAKVRFFPNGTSDQFYILLRGPEGSEKTIQLETVTGLPDVGDGKAPLQE